MIKFKDLQAQINKVKEDYEEFSIYENERAKILEELDTGRNDEGSISSSVKSIRLEKEVKRLNELALENVEDAYPLLYNSFYSLEELILKYMHQEIEGDKEFPKLRKQYLEAQEKMLRIAVENNIKLSNKVEQLKEEISSTGYFEIARLIADNDIAKSFGMRQPTTDAVTRFYPTQVKIDYPDGLYHEYKKAVKSYNNSKKGLFGFEKK